MVEACIQSTVYANTSIPSVTVMWLLVLIFSLGLIVWELSRIWLKAQYPKFAFNVDSVHRYDPSLIQLKTGPLNLNRELIVVYVAGCGVSPLRDLSPEAVQKTVAGRKIYVQLFLWATHKHSNRYNNSQNGLTPFTYQQ